MITWDTRGHGRSESPSRPELYSDSHTVADMAALLGLLNVPRAVIGGLSMGGYMSLQFALAHPEKTAALIICDTGPGYRNVDARNAWNESMLARAKELVEGYGCPERRSGRAGPPYPPVPPQGLGPGRTGHGRQRHSGVLGRLHAIDVMALVIVGELDEPFHGGIDYIASHIHGARKVVIPGAGHSSNIDGRLQRRRDRVPRPGHPRRERTLTLFVTALLQGSDIRLVHQVHASTRAASPVSVMSDLGEAGPIGKLEFVGGCCRNSCRRQWRRVVDGQLPVVRRNDPGESGVHRVEPEWLAGQRPHLYRTAARTLVGLDVDPARRLRRAEECWPHEPQRLVHSVNRTAHSPPLRVSARGLRVPAVQCHLDSGTRDPEQR